MYIKPYLLNSGSLAQYWINVYLPGCFQFSSSADQELIQGRTHSLYLQPHGWGTGVQRSHSLFCDLQGLMAFLSSVLSIRKMVLILENGVLCWGSTAIVHPPLLSRKTPTPWPAMPASVSRCCFPRGLKISRREPSSESIFLILL